MTRETKIGLLVGLAFIIVIGILLSDHLTSTTEPPQAILAEAGSSVRQGINAPGVQNPPVRLAPVPVANVQPQAPVPTPHDLIPPVEARRIVQIGASGASDQQPININITPEQAARMEGERQMREAMQRQAMQNQGDVVDPSQDQIDMAQASDTGPASIPVNPEHQTLAQIAQAAGEPIDSIDRTPTAPKAGPAATGARREYVAQEGDSLSRIAARQMGGDTRANREALKKANPSLQKNPDLVVIGQTYIIPGAVQVASARPAPEPEKVTIVKSNQPAYTYTVKPNDTLWGIAKEQLGDPRAVAAIKELNQDVLKGKDKDLVVVGMTLKLPAKPLASAE